MTLPGLELFVLGPGQVAQHFRTLAALAEAPGSIPRTHVRWLTTA